MKKWEKSQQSPRAYVIPSKKTVYTVVVFSGAGVGKQRQIDRETLFTFKLLRKDINIEIQIAP